VLDWLDLIAFHLFGEATTWAELLGFGTGLACVWLVVRQHIANWPVGIVNVLLLMVVFLRARLFGDATLQLVYVVLGGYGWWQWLFGGERHSRLFVRRTSRTEWVLLAAAGGVLVVALWWPLANVMHSTAPAADAVTTTLSLLATYGQCRKLLENWWLWIAADAIYVPLYAYKHLFLTAVLYVVFLGLCGAGLRTWWADARRPAVAVPA
jgi:nicotinamide mononucleotide transporter